MARDPNYPDKYSRVLVTLIDGEVKSYDVTAGSGLLPYLMTEAANTGALVLLCGDRTYAIPMTQIAEVEMREFNSQAEREAAFCDAPFTKGAEA
jgi:hypothetical protein